MSFHRSLHSLKQQPVAANPITALDRGHRLSFVCCNGNGITTALAPYEACHCGEGTGFQSYWWEGGRGEASGSAVLTGRGTDWEGIFKNHEKDVLVKMMIWDYRFYSSFFFKLGPDCLL